MDETENPVRPVDRLGSARRLLWAVWVASVLTAGGIIADAALRAGAPLTAPRAVLGAAGLSSLALVPSGRLSRLPADGRAGICLRHDVFLSRSAPDPVGLLIPNLGADCSAEIRP